MAIDAALGRLGIRPGVCTSSTRPANPFEGQVIYETDTNNIRFWSGSAWESNKGGIISSSAPTGAAAGDIWYDSDDGRAYIYYDDGSSQQWVEFGAAPSGSSITLASYADSAARTSAIPSPTEADLSYLQDTNSVEVYDGSAWSVVGSRYVPVTAYSPSYTNFTLGNGTDTFYYAVSGDMMMIEGKIAIGSTTVFSTSASFHIPPAYKMTTYTLGGVITNSCQITYRETGVQDIIAHGKTSNADRILFLNDLANLTYLKEAIANGATPFTFASGDEIRIRAQFLIAEAP